MKLLDNAEEAHGMVGAGIALSVAAENHAGLQRRRDVVRPLGEFVWVGRDLARPPSIVKRLTDGLRPVLSEFDLDSVRVTQAVDPRGIR